MYSAFRYLLFVSPLICYSLWSEVLFWRKLQLFKNIFKLFSGCFYLGTPTTKSRFYMTKRRAQPTLHAECRRTCSELNNGSSWPTYIFIIIFLLKFLLFHDSYSIIAMRRRLSYFPIFYYKIINDFLSFFSVTKNEIFSNWKKY